jgi:hypothetical protein
MKNAAEMVSEYFKGKPRELIYTRRAAQQASTKGKLTARPMINVLI